MSTTKNTEAEESGQCGEVGILNLPPEILLKIFELNVRDAKDVMPLKMVCKKFLKVAQSASLHKRIIIKDDKSAEGLIPIIKTYRKTIKHLEIKNVSHEKVNEVLRVVSVLYELTSLKMKGVMLLTPEVKLIKKVVKHCRYLLSFKIVGISETRWDDHWIEVLQLLSSRPMVEFSFPATFPYLCINEWDVNSFIERNRRTLTSLKIPLVRGISTKPIAKCKKLRKVHLIKSDPYYQLNTEELFPLEKLTSINIFAKRRREDDYLAKLFSRPCVIHLKSIELIGSSDYRYYVKTLEAIAKCCPKLEKLKIKCTLWFNPQGTLVDNIIQLLNSCKGLKHISLPTMALKDVLKIDKMLDVGDFAQIEYFQTSIKPAHEAEWSEYTSMPARGRSIFNRFEFTEAKCLYYSTISYTKNINLE